MKITTIEDGFEYQAEQIFNDMADDYKTEQKEREEHGDETQSFAEWLWFNREELGERFYTRLDEWVCIDEFTEEHNY